MTADFKQGCSGTRVVKVEQFHAGAQCGDLMLLLCETLLNSGVSVNLQSSIVADDHRQDSSNHRW